MLTAFSKASISAIEGQNWRHGDIEDTLLNIFMARAAGGKKFTKLDVKRVYFGNWLRDYSQAVDVGSVKYVSAEAVRLILWVLGFMRRAHTEFCTSSANTYVALAMDREHSKSQGTDLAVIDQRNILTTPRTMLITLMLVNMIGG